MFIGGGRPKYVDQWPKKKGLMSSQTPCHKSQFKDPVSDMCVAGALVAS